MSKQIEKRVLELEEEIKAQEKINDYSINELRKRDFSLHNILDISRSISSIQELDALLTKILDSLVESIHCQRGILYLNDRQKGVHPVIYRHIEEEETKKDYFRFCKANIVETAVSKSNIMRMMEEAHDGEKSFVFSFICLPLVYEAELLGVIYLDVISETKTFRLQDLDIAELFCSQAAISLHNVSLYDKIREQNLELLKLINLKDQLISDVSNKVKQPLSEIREKLAVVVQYLKEGNTCNFGEIDGISTLVLGVEATVAKVVTIQELEKEVSDLFSETVSFRELIDFIVKCHETERKKRDIAFDIKFSADFEHYHGNRAIMRTIFDELISNSIFYNRQGGTVKIHGSRKGDYLIFEISDTGFGIKMEDQEKIFEQFYRPMESTDHNGYGAGLGLFLVKKFIKYYNGDIELQSDYGKGSTFTVKMMIN